MLLLSAVRTGNQVVFQIIAQARRLQSFFGEDAKFVAANGMVMRSINHPQALSDILFVRGRDHEKDFRTCFAHIDKFLEYDQAVQEYNMRTSGQKISTFWRD